MPLNEGRKSRLVPAADVVLQQLPIGQPSPIAQQSRPAKVLYGPAHLAGRHVPSFVGLGRPSTLLLPALLSLIPGFSSTDRSSGRTPANCQIGSALAQRFSRLCAPVFPRTLDLPPRIHVRADIRHGSTDPFRTTTFGDGSAAERGSRVRRCRRQPPPLQPQRPVLLRSGEDRRGISRDDITFVVYAPELVAEVLDLVQEADRLRRVALGAVRDRRRPAGSASGLLACPPRPVLPRPRRRSSPSQERPVKWWSQNRPRRLWDAPYVHRQYQRQHEVVVVALAPRFERLVRRCRHFHPEQTQLLRQHRR